MTERIRAALVVLAMAAPSSAAAEVVWLQGFEAGWHRFAGSSNELLFDDVTGTVTAGLLTPRISTAPHPPRTAWCDYGADNPGASCSTNTDCGGDVCHTNASNRVAMTMTGSNADSEPFIVFRHGDSSLGCNARIERVGDYRWRLALDYGAGGTVCTGSENNGTSCTPCDDDSDCGAGAVCHNPGAFGACSDECAPAGAEGEQWCVDGAMGGSATFKAPASGSTAEWAEIVMCQDSSGSATRCIIADTGRQRRNGTKVLGDCSGDPATTGWACTTNGDCGTGTCTLDSVKSPAQVEIGFGDTNAGVVELGTTDDGCVRLLVEVLSTGGRDLGVAGVSTWQAAIDAAIVSDDVADLPELMVSKVVAQWPTTEHVGNFARNNCRGTNTRPECLDDTPNGGTGKADLSASYLSKGTGSPKADRYSLSAYPALGSWTVPSAFVYALTAVGRDDNDAAAGSGKRHKAWLASSGGTNNATADACTTNADCKPGASGFAQWCEDWGLGDGLTCATDWSEQTTSDSDSYHARHPYIIRSDPTGGAWDSGDFSGLEILHGWKTAANAHHVTSLVAESWLTHAAPAAPGVLTDTTGDSLVHCRIAGDSTVAVAQVHSALIALDDCDVVSWCTKGGVTWGDLAANIDHVANGLAGGYLECEYGKGAAAPVDYLLLGMLGINDFVGGGVAEPRRKCFYGSDPRDGVTNCDTNADCSAGGECIHYPGYCVGGSSHGNPCYCASNSAGAQEGRAEYCLHNDGDYLATDATSCGTCASNSDCLTGIPCASNADCPTLNTGEACDHVAGYCHARCIGTQCNGRLDPDQAVETTPFAAKGNWRAPGCTDSPDCSGGLCTGAMAPAAVISTVREAVEALEARTTVGPSCAIDCELTPVFIRQHETWPEHASAFAWSPHDDAAAITQAAIHQLFEDQGLPWVDFDLATETLCQLGDDGEHVARSSCLSDAVHLSERGLDVFGMLLKSAMTQAAGLADGRCDTGAGACEAPNRNPCTTNSDCDLYRWPSP